MSPLLILLSILLPLVSSAPTCNDNISLRLTATASNLVLPTNLNLSALSLTGQQDQVFCSRGPLDAELGIVADCGSGSTSAAAEVQKLYPNAGSYRWAQQPQIVLVLTFHGTAQSSFAIAHDFLADEGL